MMALEYIADGAKMDDTSACTITSPPIAVSPDFKRLPKTISQHLTKVNLTYSDVQTSYHESVSHQTSHSDSTSLSDITWCRKTLSVDHEASISITEMNKKLCATDCINNLQNNLSNAKDCKQKVPVKKHEQSKKKSVQVTLHQCQDFYLRK
jgi:hypothetical protein